MMLEGIDVGPKSRSEFRGFSEIMRRNLNVTGAFPIIHFLEYVMPELYGENYTFDVRDQGEMGKYHGATGVDYIYLREDVYDGACGGNGRDRFTASHELCHFIFHRDYINVLHRHQGNKIHKVYCDSEWQANTFASELLMPIELFKKCRCLEEVQETFGVSYDAAKTRNSILLKEGLVNISLC